MQPGRIQAGTAAIAVAADGIGVQVLVITDQVAAGNPVAPPEFQNS